jgi:hypothetical protein
MKLQRVAPDYGYVVDITWSRPLTYSKIVTDGSRHDAEGWFYMILGYRGSSHPKLFYIGKVFEKCVSQRLRQADHRVRYEQLRSAHPRHSFRVSLGAVKLARGHITARRIDEIESILIFGAYHSRDTLINKNKWWKSGWRHPYVIRNLRSRVLLPREIHHGVFIR